MLIDREETKTVFPGTTGLLPLPHCKKFLLKNLAPPNLPHPNTNTAAAKACRSRGRPVRVRRLRVLPRPRARPRGLAGRRAGSPRQAPGVGEEDRRRLERATLGGGLGLR